MTPLKLRRPFLYRDFHDLPRALVVSAREGALLLLCPFMDDRDDYSDRFEIYWMEGSRPLDGSWDSFPPSDSTHLGSVPVGQVRFDDSRRRTMDLCSLGEAVSHVLGRFRDV